MARGRNQLAITGGAGSLTNFNVGQLTIPGGRVVQRNTSYGHYVNFFVGPVQIYQNHYHSGRFEQNIVVNGSSYQQSFPALRPRNHSQRQRQAVVQTRPQVQACSVMQAGGALSQSQYNCERCRFTFTTWEQCENHMNLEGHWGCYQCNRMFRFQFAARDHMNAKNHWRPSRLAPAVAISSPSRLVIAPATPNNTPSPPAQDSVPLPQPHWTPAPPQSIATAASNDASSLHSSAPPAKQTNSTPIPAPTVPSQSELATSLARITYQARLRTVRTSHLQYIPALSVLNGSHLPQHRSQHRQHPRISDVTDEQGEGQPVVPESREVQLSVAHSEHHLAVPKLESPVTPRAAIKVEATTPRVAISPLIAVKTESIMTPSSQCRVSVTRRENCGPTLVDDRPTKRLKIAQLPIWKDMRTPHETYAMKRRKIEEYI